MCPVEDWNAGCGYEEALHSNGGTSIACERGPVWPGIKCHLVKTFECGCQRGGMGVPS